VPARVNAVAYFRIVDPNTAIVHIENFMVATSQIAKNTLRSVLGQHMLDKLLSERATRSRRTYKRSSTRRRRRGGSRSRLVIEEHPVALQLRYLQTLLKLGASEATNDRLPGADRPADAVPPPRAPKSGLPPRADRSSPRPANTKALGGAFVRGKLAVSANPG
jgi:hypothetical protein